MNGCSHDGHTAIKWDCELRVGERQPEIVFCGMVGWSTALKIFVIVDPCCCLLTSNHPNKMWWYHVWCCQFCPITQQLWWDVSGHLHPQHTRVWEKSITCRSQLLGFFFGKIMFQTLTVVLNTVITMLLHAFSRGHHKKEAKNIHISYFPCSCDLIKPR